MFGFLRSKTRHDLIETGITSFPRLGVNYWGITKCASTSMKHHLLEQELGRRTTFRQPTAIHAKIAGYYISREDGLSNGRVNFTVTRHPVSRALSAWRDLCHTRPERGIAAGIDPSWSFRDLMTFVAERDDDDLDVHFRSQSWFITAPLEHEIDQKELNPCWPFEFAAPTVAPMHESVKSDTRLHDDVLALIAARYAADFRRFGYDPVPAGRRT